MAIRRCDGVRVTVDLAGQPLHAQVWRADVGRIPLYLLDADIEDNPDDVRQVTDRLYGGDTEHRLRQEILLGVGGVRALDALGIDAQVFHTNEGHAGLPRPRAHAPLHRRRRAELPGGGRGGAGRVHLHHPHAGASGHRPLPPRAHGGVLLRLGQGVRRERSTSSWPSATGPYEEPTERFNMAVMGLRLAGRSNGVSKLHGAVSRDMFADLWPGVPPDEVPITSITNGVHAGTWVSPEMSDLLGRRVLPEWAEAGPERWAMIDEAADDEIWRVREQGRERLVQFVRRAPAGVRARPWRVGVRRGVVRRGARPRGPHDLLRPSLRHLQAGEPRALPARAAPRAAALDPAPGAVRVRRQGPPGRRRGQGDDPPDRRLRGRAPTCATASCSSRTTTSRSPARSTTAPTCG